MQNSGKFSMSCINPEILSFQSTPLKVLFASETGNSAKVAQMIHIQALKRGFLSSIHSLNQNLVKFNLSLPSNCTENQQSPENTLSHICIIVCSSTGNGDPPKNGEKFIKYLRRNRKNNSLLRHVRFAIMGLGDSNYTKYQGIPIYIQEKMKEMGATQIYKRGQVDDAYSQPEEVVVPWISSLWEILSSESYIQRHSEEECEKSEDDVANLSPLKGDFKYSGQMVTPTKSPNKASPSSVNYDYKNHARLRVKRIEIITGKQAIKQVKLITLDLSNLLSQFEVQIGGSISIFPENREELVLKFLDYFEITSSKGSFINNPRLVHELQKKYDFTSQVVPLSFLNALKDFLPEQSELIQLYTLIQNYNKKVKNEQLNTIEALDIILGCDEKLKIYSVEDFSILMNKLPQIKPRLYSIVQNHDNGNEISFALSMHSFQVVRRKQKMTKIGFSSMFLDNLTEGNHVSAFPMANTSIFRNLQVNSFKFSNFIPSMLFFAHGTSITPILSYLRSFISFLEENEQSLNQNIKVGGPISLFYGCRSCDENHCDFLFKNQIEDYFSLLKRKYHKDCCLKVAESYQKVFEAEMGIGNECEIGEWHGIQVNSQYVYDLITQNNEIVEKQVLQDKGIICLCGDGTSMSRIVEDRINFVIQKKTKFLNSQSGAVQVGGIMQNLIKCDRYFKETWMKQ